MANGPWDKLARKVRAARARKNAEAGKPLSPQDQRDILNSVSDSDAEKMLRNVRPGQSTQGTRVVGLPEWATQQRVEVRGEGFTEPTPDERGAMNQARAADGGQQGGGNLAQLVQQQERIADMMNELLQEVRRITEGL